MACWPTEMTKQHNDIVYAGIEPFIAHLDTLPVWEDRERFHKICEDFEFRFDSIMNILCSKMNSTHGVDESRRYWEVIFGDWVRLFLSILMDRRERLLTQSESAWPFSVQETIESPVPCDTHLSYTLQALGYQNDVFLYQCLAQHITSGDIPLVGPTKTAPDENPKRCSKLWHTVSLNLQIAKLRLSKCIFINTSFSAVSNALWKHKIPSTILGKPKDYRVPNRFYDGTLRAPLKFSNNEDSLLDCAGNILYTQLPAYCVELFRDYKSIAQRIVGANTSKVFITDHHQYTHHFAKFLSAEIISRGGTLLSMQHGGGYGIDKYLIKERHEISIADAFLSWGWEDSLYKNKIFPLPSIKLSTAPNIPHTPKQLLFVTTELPKKFYNLESVPLGCEYEQSLQDTLTFMDTAGAKIRKELSIRPPTMEFEWKTTDQIRQNFPDLASYDRKGSFAQSIKQSRVVIIGHLATTFLETLTHNIPTIVFYSPDLYTIRDNAKPFFDQLEEAGIMHTSPISAAKQIRAVADSPADWWEDEKVQHSKNTFIRRFAWKSDNYASIWADAIKSISASKGRLDR